MTPPRVRPGDAFASLRRRAGEALVREKVTGDANAAWVELRAIDAELWPVVRDALASCRTNGGKLHPDIAAHLLDIVDAGIAGRLPPSWPEPTGHRSGWRNDPEPQAVAAAYRMAVAEGLVDDPQPTKTITNILGTTTRTSGQWQKKHKVEILIDPEGSAVISCVGLTVYCDTTDKQGNRELLLKALKDCKG